MTGLATLPALQRRDLRDALAAYLVAVADDELILGHRHSEWTGFGPDIESDVALSSIAQEELGHARLFYERACELTGGEPDRYAFGRTPEQFRNAVLLERPNQDWGFTIVRMFLYDQADQGRLEALTRGPLRPLAELAATVRREEKYHVMYGEQWLRRLAASTAASRARMQDALTQAWSEALALFEPVPGQGELVAAGVLAHDGATQVDHWRQTVVQALGEVGLKVPEGQPAVGGRSGRHSDDLRRLLDEMTSVWRTEPDATW